MSRHPSRAAPALLALTLAASLVAPAWGQQPPRPRGGDRPGADKAARAAAPPVIACPSVANYRMLMHDGTAAAAATLADPKADHLGCTTLPRTRLGAIVDRVTLAGKSYDCAAVQGTTVCHWLAAGTLPGTGEDGWR